MSHSWAQFRMPGNRPPLGPRHHDGGRSLSTRPPLTARWNLTRNQGGSVFGSKKTDEEKQAAKQLGRIRTAAAAAGVTVIGAKFHQAGQAPIPVEGSTVTIELGETARKRITATRVALTGIFALWLKKDESKLYVTVEHPDGVILYPVAAKKEPQARVFATLVNGRSTGVTAAE
ncbi:hypothetical protein SSIG_02106 [Streptomyces filamentosus NRRL 11379]|nr:hypothetical protein SSIG_02106 [Streptomyces filamentosus NRRL 11379]